MQYADNTDCMGHCAQFPQGVWNDTAANTLGCRIYHTVAAFLTGDVIHHCKHGAASGENYCGTWCDVYCQLAQDNCQGANQLFDNTTTCMSACSMYNSLGSSGDASGDSVQCRIYHLGVAGLNALNANTHCPHANVTSAGNV